jgi:hypothetical protein
LVGDADSLDVLRRVTLSLESFDGAIDTGLDGRDKVMWVMFVPAKGGNLSDGVLTTLAVHNSPGLGIYLLELKLVCYYNLALGVEDQKAGASGALINGANKGVRTGMLVGFGHFRMCLTW